MNINWPDFFWYSMPLYFLAAALEILFSLKRKPFLGKAAIIIGWLAFLSHTVFLSDRTITSGGAPFSGFFASLNFFIWCLGLFYYTFSLRKKQRDTGIIILPLISVLLLLSSKSPQNVSPLPVVLQTIWFEIHVGSAFVSYALFGIGAAAAAVSLILNKADSTDGDSADFTYRALSWGMLAFSISMASGGIWAYKAWCDYWIWTPKELWSAIIWLFYSVYIHAGLTHWKGKKAQIMAVAGFIIVLITYLGVGLLMKSSHPL